MATQLDLWNAQFVGKLIAPVVEPGAVAAIIQPEIAIDDEISLRPFDTHDATVVVDAYSSPDIQHYHFRRFDTDDEGRRWIEDCAQGWRSETCATWAIVDRASKQIVGRVAIHLSLEDGHGEVSYWVLPAARRRGVATRACEAATGWAHRLGLHRIQLEHSTRNEGSRRVALSAGFTSEGVRRGANLHDDGWHDMALYSHLATDD